MKLLRNLAVIILVIGLLSYGQIKKRVVGDGPLQSDSTAVIAKGAYLSEITKDLYERGIIADRLIFRLWLKFNRLDTKIKAGEYLFTPKISMQQVIEKITSGDVLYHKITLPEGWTVGQILYALSMNDNLSGELDYFPEEGSLLPETYAFQRGESRNAFVKNAEQAMQQVLTEVWNGRADNLPYKNMNEMLVMASIIEKETSIASERPQVASVFVNRLRKGMRLQTDPTVIYALTEGREELKRSLSRKDLEIDSPYNTYKYAGLPPKPICNPGKEALYAAAHPDDTPFLYFVADGFGGHNFAKTLQEHNDNVAAWKRKK